MIVTRLAGGLGNQLFQYAAGRRLALSRNVPLGLDLSWFERFEERAFLLHHFRIQAEVIEPSRLKIVRPTFLGRLVEIAGRVGDDVHLRRFDERHFHFDPQVLGLPDRSYLVGYWQSEKYFIDREDPIRQDLRLKQPASGRNADLLDLIERSESVSVHVRRGDYVNSQTVSVTHGTCSPEYYRRSLAFMRERLQSPTFYFFSDDPDWVRETFSDQPDAVFVTHNSADDPHEDLRLMAACRHSVIANSTLSWWGAWLNPSRDRYVCAPRQWFAPGVDRMATDLLLPSWQCH